MAKLGWQTSPPAKNKVKLQEGRYTFPVANGKEARLGKTASALVPSTSGEDHGALVVERGNVRASRWYKGIKTDA